MAQSSKTRTRRERERQMRRDAILQAAREVFAKRGYEQATLDEIAQRAEFGKGTLYNYFPGGKEELLMVTLEQLYDNLEALTKSIFQDAIDSPETLLKSFQQFITAHLRFFEENRDIFHLLIKEAHRLMLTQGKAQAQHLILQRERLITHLVPVFTSAMEAGLLRPMDPHLVAHTLLGNIYGMMFAMHMKQHCPLAKQTSPPLSSEEAATFLTSVLFEGLLNRTRNS